MVKLRQFLLLLVLIAFTSCEEDTWQLESLKGEYEGTFLRSSPNARFQPAKVTMVFEGDSFSGSSSIRNYPAICRGKFTMNNDQVTFENSCFFTADFDWSLILSGTWKITCEGDEIVLTKKSGSITDWYWLKKKTGD
jgi:hypothetical protein